MISNNVLVIVSCYCFYHSEDDLHVLPLRRDGESTPLEVPTGGANAVVVGLVLAHVDWSGVSRGGSREGQHPLQQRLLPLLQSRVASALEVLDRDELHDSTAEEAQLMTCWLIFAEFVQKMDCS